MAGGRDRQSQGGGSEGSQDLKTLGLYLRDGGPSGTLVRVDDARFDGMWEACGVLGLPVAMHVGDPEAFFEPIDRFNERYEELSAHPDWSFHGRDFPAFRDVLSAQTASSPGIRRRRSWHCTWVTGLRTWQRSARCSTNSPMFTWKWPRGLESSAGSRERLSAFRQNEDRILSAPTPFLLAPRRRNRCSAGTEPIYYRFLETEDQYFNYAPARVPPQGRWRIYGLGLPEPILRKVITRMRNAFSA